MGRGSFQFVAGAWNKVKFHVRLNTPNNFDGYVKVWFNGKVVIDYETLNISATPATHPLNGIFFHTYFGGSTIKWATPIDTYANFKDFSLLPV